MIRHLTRDHRGRRFATAAACLAAGLATASIALQASSKAKLLSEWAATPVVVDGVNNEWPTLVSIDKDVRFSIAVKNDGQYLYLALITSDGPTASQALNSGLIVWFDAGGGSKKRLGIKYPLGREPGSQQGAGEGRGGAGGWQRGRPSGSSGDEGNPAAGSGGQEGQPPDPERAWSRRLADPRLTLAELLGPGKDDVKSLALDLSQPIRMKLGHAEGMLVYELAIPLAKTTDSPDGLGVGPGAVVGIGLETPERKTSTGSAPGGYGGGMGGRGGGMGGRGGGMGGGYGGMGGRGGGMGGRGGEMGGPGGAHGQAQKPLKVWTTVQLATPPPSR